MATRSICITRVLLPACERQAVLECPQGKGGAAFTRFYLWVHIVAGWIITALFAASLTGLVKRDV